MHTQGVTIQGDADSFRRLARRARRRLLQMHYESRVGHIGGNLSALDVMLYLHHRVMEPDDRFILAKGHSAGALYITLWSLGLLSDQQIDGFHCDGSKLAGHPPANWLPEIPVATGSLGHGFPIACGLALARKLERRPGHIYCLCSDGEWQEGSNWEALIFANHRRLDNLTLLVDANGLQGFGTTAEIASMQELGKRFAAFGFEVRQVNGHDPESLCTLIQPNGNGPRAIILNTVKGKGVSFMENRMEWHYLPLNAELYARAMRDLDAP